VRTKGLAPLRGRAGGSAAITPVAKNLPLATFLNAPFKPHNLHKTKEVKQKYA